MDMTVLSYDGIEIYQNEIDILCNDYMNSIGLNNASELKAMQFNGMLLYIYNNKLKYIFPKSYKNDYDLLNDIFFNIYIPLCYRYGYCPTILQFCTMLVNIDNTNISDIKNGVYRGNEYKVNPNTTQTVKKWYSVCENGLLNKAIETNGIGSIFALKANYKYRDNDTVQVIPLTDSTLSTGQILEKYGKTEKPKLIDFDNE